MMMGKAHSLATSDLFVEDMQAFLNRVADKIGEEHTPGFVNAMSVAYEQLQMHRNSASAKNACAATVENEATLVRLAYGGTYTYKLAQDSTYAEVYGCGHHGPDAVGKASERSGKGIRYTTAGARPIHII